MDEARRQALIARFQAGSLERIGRIRAAIADLAGGAGGAPARTEVLRELHTLKGEARMLGFGELSDLAHGVEERMQAPDLLEHMARLAPRLTGALEDAAAWLRAGAGASTERLVAQLEALRAGDAAAALPVPEEPEDREPAEDRWVQVAASRIDTVCERLSEVETELGALWAQLASSSVESGGRRPLDAVRASRARRALIEQATRCRSLLEEASDAAWSLRLVPVEPSLRDLAVHARELSLALGKQVDVTVNASRAEMERSVLDELRQPLLHLVRNAIDHGIPSAAERPGPARLALTAEPSESGVALTVSDDGRGVSPDEVRKAAVAQGLIAADAALTDAQALDLLFQHGFSTRAKVSSLSGRGVGLDVVRAKVEALGGTVHLASSRGQGTTVTIDVPAQIAKERALVVSIGEALFGLPSRWVREVRRRADAEVLDVAGGQALRRDGVLIPLRSLSRILGGPAVPGERDEAWIVVLEWAGRLWGFLAPTVLGEFELLRRPIDAFVAQCAPAVASGVLDDGRLVLLTPPGALLRRGDAPARARAGASAPPAPRRRILVVDDSPVVRDLVASLLEATGLEVARAEGADTALRLVEEGPPDLVLADIEMPGIDGLELLRLIRLRTEHLPVVMLTTRGSPEDRRRAAELGADAYLVKSEFREQALIDTVNRFLGGSPS